MQVYLVTRQVTGIVEVEHEARLFTDEHRLHVARVDLQLCQVAEGVQHGQPRGGGEQEGEHITQAQVVVDVAKQHQTQHEGESGSLFGGDDVDAALVEDDRARLEGAAERPVAEELFEAF